MKSSANCTQHSSKTTSQMSISNKISGLLKYYRLTEGQSKIQHGKPSFHCFLCNLNKMRNKI